MGFLHDYNSVKVRHGKKSDPAPYLDSTEEQKLTDNIITVAKIGYRKIRKEVKMKAENVVKEKDVL